MAAKKSKGWRSGKREDLPRVVVEPLLRTVAASALSLYDRPHVGRGVSACPRSGDV